MDKKSISILGSTGSIGTQALNIIRNRKAEFELQGLAAGSNIDLLREQIKEFKPKFASINSDQHKKALAQEFPELEILKDSEEFAVQKNIDIFVSAIVGIEGLKPNLRALQYAKRVAIANKETLVAAPHLVRQYREQHASELIPIDSEHVAIHQCLERYFLADPNAEADKKQIKQVLLTSSGGPFRTTAIKDLKNVSLEQALQHPTWKMGPKITIDSSTLMNKSLEIIEINSLFDIDYDKIQIVIHPQSVVHSAVTFVDGTTMAQLGNPDMMVPIQYAIDFPHKAEIELKQDFSIFDYPQLEFYPPDKEKFPAVELAYRAGKAGGSAPSVFNSANEAAVDLFLQGKIEYLDIVAIVAQALNNHIDTKQILSNPSADELICLDKELKLQIKEGKICSKSFKSLL